MKKDIADLKTSTQHNAADISDIVKEKHGRTLLIDWKRKLYTRSCMTGKAI